MLRFKYTINYVQRGVHLHKTFYSSKDVEEWLVRMYQLNTKEERENFRVKSFSGVLVPPKRRRNK